MNGELEAVVAHSTYYLGIFLEGLKKSTKILRISGVTVEIRSQHIMNTSLELYRYTSLVGDLL
jgi:hypothetical protein